MKVAIFAYTDDAPTLDTGVTTYNRELVRSLCVRFPGHTFSVYLAGKNSEKFYDLEFTNLTKIILPGSKSWMNGSGGGATAAASAMFAVVSEVMHRLRIGTRMRHPLYDSIAGLDQYDLIIYTVFGYLPHFPLYIKRNYGIKCISVIHDVRVLYADSADRKNSLWSPRGKFVLSRYLLSRIVRESDRSLVPSNYIKAVLSSRYRRSADRVFVSHVVPDVCAAEYEPASISSRVRDILDAGRRYVFYPSTIVESKNHISLVKAMKLLCREFPEARLILAGSNIESPLAAEVFRYIADNGLQDSVVHLGFVSEADKRALYRAAVALVIPSIGESFSLPIWEAFAHGCPVIASTDRDIPEQVTDAALLCDPRSPDDIALKMRDLWLDAGARRQLAAMGRARYEKVKRDSLFTGWESLIQ